MVVIDDAEVVTMLAGSGKSDGNSRQDTQMMSQLFGGLKSINGFVRDLKHGGDDSGGPHHGYLASVGLGRGLR